MKICVRTPFPQLAAFALASAALAVGPAALGQNPPPQLPPSVSPDQLQSLGVGSRAVAMGNAFSAIADDASATFWNPARLGSLQSGRYFMGEFRSVVGSRFTLNDANTPNEDGGPSARRIQPGFISVLWPVNTVTSAVVNKQAKKSSHYFGTLGLSWALGGYYNSSLESIQHGMLGNTPIKTVSDSQITIRNQFVTLAYGNKIALNKHSGTLEVGLAGFYLEHGQRRSAGSATFDNTNPNNPTQINGTPTTDVHEQGSGLGYLLGLSYQPDEKNKVLSKFRLAFTYRSRTAIDDLTQDATLFGDELPSRMTAGISFEDRHPKGLLTVAAEAQSFSDANQKQNVGNVIGFQQDRRDPVTNYHFGMEWLPYNGPLVRLNWLGITHTPIRFGFHTNANAARLYTSYDDVYSFGFAMQKRDGETVVFSLDPTVEVLPRSRLVQYTISGNFKF